MPKPELGGRYRDVISGFAGVAVARTEYLHSVTQVQLLAEDTGNDDEKERWIPEPRLESADRRGVGFGEGDSS